MHGLHLIAELHDCSGDPRLLASAAALRELCTNTCRAFGLTPVGELFHQFDHGAVAGGVTGAVVLAESHLAVHTWPELKAVTLDLYVCNFSQDNRAAARRAGQQLIAAFAPARIVQREIERGTPRRLPLAGAIPGSD